MVSFFRKIFGFKQDTPKVFIEEIRKNCSKPNELEKLFKSLYEKLSADRDYSLIEEAIECHPIPIILNAMDKCTTSNVIDEYGCKVLIVFKNYAPDYTKDSINSSKLLRVLERIHAKYRDDTSDNAKILITLVKGEEKEEVDMKDNVGEDVEMQNNTNEDVVMKENAHETEKEKEKEKVVITIPKAPEITETRNVYVPKVIKVELENFREPEKKRPRPSGPCDETIGTLFNGFLLGMKVGLSTEKLEEWKAHVRYYNLEEIMDDNTALAMCWYMLKDSFDIVLRNDPASKKMISSVKEGFNKEKVVKEMHTGPFYFVVRDGFLYDDIPVPVTSSLEYAKETLEAIKKDGETYSIVMLENAFGCDMTDWAFEEKEMKKGMKKLIIKGSEIKLTETIITLDGCTKLVKAECTHQKENKRELIN